ncbi:PDDEXK nuclease domain-containing protein [Legionella longbeachae]|uniref:PDDEXK nuclease domain-containing protein n=1 Tax=Legionella longbeachae TaxID=450 RepID=UPI001CC1D96D|nr:PDDEXK nuclease domain-containing protein [Legionella longbeachae]
MGRDIVTAEQEGQARAAYGSQLLQELPTRLTKKYGKGFSVSTLRDIRQFYLVYPNIEIHHAARSKSSNELSLSSNLELDPLSRIDRQETRQFYTVEAEKNAWSGRELERQINSLLFDRLAKSKDKEGLLALSRDGQEINQPEDAIKEPLILEFLGLPEPHRLVESKLEEALINNLQKFLLELGTGFSYIGRQKRLTFDGDHYYADLVFYHVILKCYIIIDLKTRKLTHADLGQMQLYVNYFDAEIKQEDDNPTIGLVLCHKKVKQWLNIYLAKRQNKSLLADINYICPQKKNLKKRSNEKSI